MNDLRLARKRVAARVASRRGRRGKQPVQEFIGQAAPVVALPGELAPIVLGQGAGIRLDGLYAGAVAHRRASPPYLRKQLLDGAQFLECRPIGVALAPAGS